MWSQAANHLRVHGTLWWESTVLVRLASHYTQGQPHDLQGPLYRLVLPQLVPMHWFVHDRKKPVYTRWEPPQDVLRHLFLYWIFDEHCGGHKILDGRIESQVCRRDHDSWLISYLPFHSYSRDYIRLTSHPQERSIWKCAPRGHFKAH